MAKTNSENNVEIVENSLRKVKLPLTREKQDDVFVAVNGQTFQIQRGVEVEVPQNIYEVLLNSERMDELAFERSRKLPNRQ